MGSRQSKNTAEILFVNQDPDITRMLQIYFESAGFKVDCASSGITALRLCSEHDYDFAVLDVNLPDMDGYEILRQLRSQDASTPVIYLTHEKSQTSRIKVLELGAIDFITMPFDLQELQLKIINLLRLKAIYLNGDIDRP